MAEPSPTIELEVDTGANEIFSQTGAAGDGLATVEARACQGRAVEVRAANVDEEILNLGGPVVGKGPLNAGAGRPASLIVSIGDAVEDGLHVGESATSGAIEQDAVRGITGASAQCRQPVIAGLACPGDIADRGGCAGIDPRPVPIAFDPEDKAAGLPVNAERAAGNAATVIK